MRKRALIGVPALALSAALFAFLFISQRAGAVMNFSTGVPLSGPLEQYWNANGGTARFGMPLTGVFPTADGYAAQWFERALLTYDPNAAPADRAQPQKLGWIAASDLCTESAFTRVTSGAAPQGSQYFAATGHLLSGKLLSYWRANNGLAQFGMPLSEAFTSRSGNTDYTVQYFEYARLELSPSGTVSLGLLGSELLAKQGGASAYASLTAPAFYTAPANSANPHKLGHAADYSWIAGRVAGLQSPQGGPLSERPIGPPQVKVGADPVLWPPVAEPLPTALPNGVIVGHSSHSDTSRPLRDITPRPATAECSPMTGDTYLPTGAGWDLTRVQEGTYVVLYGHLAAPSEAPGLGGTGRVYIVDRMDVQP